MEELRVDLVVIGSGPAGQKAAIQAAKLGQTVVVIERLPEPGGNSLYFGTIPSKSLREAIIDLTRFNERGFCNQLFDPSGISIADLNNRLAKVIEGERALVARQFKKNKIRLILGGARFENSHNILVFDNSYQLQYQIRAEYFVIATGSQPRNPTDIPFDETTILDSTRLLHLGRIPTSMIVLGGGVIGSEYASFFAALGTRVTIIDKRDHLLPMLDKEIGLHLQHALGELGLTFMGNKEPAKIERRGDEAVVLCKDGTELVGESVLYALGRKANIDALHLENAGVLVDEKGYVRVNELFQTTTGHIYGVGDVIGGPSLASTGMEQGRLAARHAFGATTHHFPLLYPMGIYTIPEISSCGYTEEELQAMGFHYEVGRAYYYEIARSHIVGNTTGLFKLLFHAETLELLGVHVVGRGATEVIHIGLLAMDHRAKVNYFIDQVFNYPTYAEGYRIAALNGMNKIHRPLNQSKALEPPPPPLKAL